MTTIHDMQESGEAAAAAPDARTHTNATEAGSITGVPHAGSGTNPMANTGAGSAAPPEPIMQFFEYEHLPAHLQIISAPFGRLAEGLVATLPRNAERTVALRKLLESKDAAVRAALTRYAQGYIGRETIIHREDVPK